MADVEITVVVDEDNLPVLERGVHLLPDGYADVWFRLDKRSDSRYVIHARGHKGSETFAAGEDIDRPE